MARSVSDAFLVADLLIYYGEGSAKVAPRKETSPPIESPGTTLECLLTIANLPEGIR